MTDMERARATMTEVYDALPADLGDTTDYEREECRRILAAAFAAVRSEALEDAARTAEDTSTPSWSYPGEVTAAVAARIRSLAQGEGVP